MSEAVVGLELPPVPDTTLWTRVLSFPARAESLASARAEVSEVLRPLALPESTMFDVRVAVGEALSNAIRHGSPQGGGDTVTVDVLAHRDRVDEVKAALNLTSFTEVSFPELSNYPAEEIGIATDELAHLDVDEERLTERAHELEAAHYERAVAIAEWLVAERDAITVRFHDVGEGSRRIEVLPSAGSPPRASGDA